MVPLANKDGEKFVPADPSNVASYPLSRFLYLYVNAKPASPLDPLRAEFIKLVFSQQGQEVVIKDGYLPISAEVAKQDLASVGIK